MEFTLSTGQILAFAGAIVVLNGAGAAVANIIRRFMRPNQLQDERLDGLDNEIAAVKGFLDNDNKKIKEIERGNRVTHQALLALLESNLNGNNVDEMQRAKKALTDYLINKR